MYIGKLKFYFGPFPSKISQMRKFFFANISVNIFFSSFVLINKLSRGSHQKILHKLLNTSRLSPISFKASNGSTNLRKTHISFILTLMLYTSIESTTLRISLCLAFGNEICGIMIGNFKGKYWNGIELAALLIGMRSRIKSKVMGESIF